MTTKLRPDADSVDGNWTNELGGTTLYTSIDEAAVDDADYIQSGDDPANDICKIRLSDPSGTPIEPAYVRFRYKKSGPGTMDLTVALLEGSTTRATWSFTDISSSFVTTQEQLSTPEFSSITDFNNLYLQFTANISDELPYFPVMFR